MTALILLALVLPSSSCFIGAAFVARKGKEGWGWLLFIGLLIAPPPSAFERVMTATHTAPNGR